MVLAVHEMKAEEAIAGEKTGGAHPKAFSIQPPS